MSLYGNCSGMTWNIERHRGESRIRSMAVWLCANALAIAHWRWFGRWVLVDIPGWKEINVGWREQWRTYSRA